MLPPSTFEASFQAMLRDMDPAQRHAGLSALGLAAGLRPPPKEVSELVAEKVLCLGVQGSFKRLEQSQQLLGEFVHKVTAKK